MKKILLITLLSIPFISFSQTTKPIEGFLGIKFGSSKLTVINAMKAKGSKIAATEKNDIAFSNVRLGKNETEGAKISFVANKAYEADFSIEPDVEGHTIDLYNGIVADFTSVYGPGKTKKEYTSPYKEGDGNTYLGLSVGKINFETDWLDANKNLITISIIPQNDGKLTIGVSYLNNALSDENDKIEANQNKSDL